MHEAEFARCLAAVARQAVLVLQAPELALDSGTAAIQVPPALRLAGDERMPRSALVQQARYSDEGLRLSTTGSTLGAERRLLRQLPRTQAALTVVDPDSGGFRLSGGLQSTEEVMRFANRNANRSD